LLISAPFPSHFGLAQGFVGGFVLLKIGVNLDAVVEVKGQRAVYLRQRERGETDNDAFRQLAAPVSVNDGIQRHPRPRDAVGAVFQSSYVFAAHNSLGIIRLFLDMRSIYLLMLRGVFLSPTATNNIA
jgi:hypothetical protein